MKEIPSGHMDMLARTNTGHAFVAINVGIAVPIELFKAHMDTMSLSIKGAPKAEGSRRIDLPGEIDWEKRDVALKHGIELPHGALAGRLDLGRKTGLNTDGFFAEKES